MEAQRRLDDILGRDIGLQWFEGVALVQAVCEQVLMQGPADAFPRAADVAVAADGSITLFGKGGGPAVAAAGELLASMVGDDVPVRLRLAITEATARESPYPHLAAFVEALAYFERPGRRELIVAVCARAATASPRNLAQSVHTPEKPPAPGTQAPEEKRSRRRRASLTPVLLGAAAVLAALVWIVPHHRQFPAVISELVAQPPAEESPAGATGNPAPAVGRRPELKPTRARSPQVMSSSAPATARFDTRPAATPQIAPREVFYDSLEVVATDLAYVRDESRGDAGPPVYSREDGFVSPPRPMRPQLPPEPPFDPAVGPPTELELVIAASGLVESAKLRSAPRNITEFMLVSAAKAWIFQPAELDGHPVRYRHRVRLILP